MCRFPALANFETRYGPEFTLRYNEYRSAAIIGSAAPGYSSEQATAALEDVFKQSMPHEMGFDYQGMSLSGAESPPRGSRMGNLWPLAGSSYSWCWPRCMRAGRFPGACC